MCALLTPDHHDEDRMIWTPPRPVDIAAVFPELAGQERATVRLHPRRGRPGPRDSSVGGPLLWPAAEPWPRCDAADRHTMFAPIGADADGRTLYGSVWDPRHPATPMVAVAQLFARDVADLPCPGGTDVCQVLWCPRDHELEYGPRVRVHWRASGPALGADLALPPSLPSDLDTIRDEFIPKPCSVSPEQTIDYPDWWELTEELRERIEAWEQGSGWIYASHLGAAPGTRVGGWPEWIQDPEWPTCPRGHAMDHLLTMASWEYDADSWRTWRPLDLPDGRDDAGLMLGDAGNVYIFTCVTCDDRPSANVLQCS
jgi:hypothetical protein